MSTPESDSEESATLESLVAPSEIGVDELSFEDWAYLVGLTEENVKAHMEAMARPPTEEEIANAINIADEAITSASGDSFTIPGPVTPKFYPTHVGGDRDFHGNGPHVWVNAELFLQNGGRSLYARVYMHALETKNDWTEVLGTRLYHLYTHNSPIEITSDRYSSRYYRDTDHSDDWLSIYGPDAVQKFRCTGDTKGNDAGYRTGVKVYFQPVTMREL